MFKFIIRLGTAVALSLGASTVVAQDFPTKPVTWIVPYSPGGITDTRARLIAAEFGKALGQTVIVENKPGAGGTLGVEYVARSDPDGYTIIYGSLGTQAAAPSLYADLRYNSLEDFVPVHMMGSSPNTLIAYKDMPYNTPAELVDYAKAHPGEVTVGLAGIGTGTHLASELFANAARIEVLHVPYKGSAPMLNDLIAGRLDIAFDYPVSTLGHVQSGAVKVLGVTSAERLALFPDAPTMAEAGFPDAETGSWSGIFAPAGTPPERVEILADAFAAAMESPEVKDAFDKVQSEVWMMRGEEMQTYVAEEIERWTRIISDAGIEKR
ncbi:Bug family tripartite tricarboxylate transporter substrate binding protein [Pseudosulfitobacter pseudonitzschiae]|uniref:Tripartite tricarboxylate transporter family receptor n=1 Tax=Pseudosulfitobacter pseudonitzschiae TaxID=1402135 RepID=A0A221K7L2_9RHOB|nr:tripartite tricarboxylate transporter substrate binding protein [Pseudosulfitobacter pseudonitzschiae]ASM74998.1 tripartite tricarboxylate transporter family receptor [Pseudosulfitobacter pseudonitzschiae]